MDVVEASVVLSFVDSLSEIVDSLKEALRLREQEVSYLMHHFSPNICSGGMGSQTVHR